VSDLGGSAYTTGSVGNALYAIRNNKYVSLDLSSSTFTSIVDYAFFNALLTNVTIPTSVTNIGENAFQYCYPLTSITLPDNVISIGSAAFAGCTSLTAINVDTGNSTYLSQDGVLYNKDKTTLLIYPAGKTGNSFTIPDSVNSIGNLAFANCTNLTIVTIPDSVNSIGKQAFFPCKNLVSVIFATGSNITDDNFGINATATFNTNGSSSSNEALKNAYKIGRAGTYTRNEDGSVWTKTP